MVERHLVFREVSARDLQELSTDALQKGSIAKSSLISWNFTFAKLREESRVTNTDAEIEISWLPKYSTFQIIFPISTLLLQFETKMNFPEIAKDRL